MEELKLIQYKRGITLTEVIVAVAISAILIVGTMKLLSVGMKGSTKGLSHQHNMETATIIMSQIEYDLMKSVCLIDPAKNKRESNARWIICDDLSKNKLAYVNYDKNASGGIIRTLQPKDAQKQAHIFGKEHYIDFYFTRVECSYSNKKGETNEPSRYAVYVELTVKAKDKRKQAESEQFSLNRLICVNNNIIKSDSF